MLDTAPLIPTNGVHITPTYHPSGWFVARYDAEGFVAEQRWFTLAENARSYAEALRDIERLVAQGLTRREALEHIEMFGGAR